MDKFSHEFAVRLFLNCFFKCVKNKRKDVVMDHNKNIWISSLKNLK